MKPILLRIYFLIFSSNFINVFCAKLQRVELDYRESNGDYYLQDFEKNVEQHMVDVNSELKKDGIAQLVYLIQPPKNADNTTDLILIDILQKTIAKISPSVDYNLSSEQTVEQEGDSRTIVLIQYDLTFSDEGVEYTVYVDSDDLESEKNLSDIITSAYDGYEKTPEGNYTVGFKLLLPPNTTEVHAEKLRKDFLKLFWTKKRLMEKDYYTDEKSQLHYDANNNLQALDFTINFVSSNNTTLENKTDLDYTFEPIKIDNSDAAIKEMIIAELLRHIKLSKQSWWFKRSNTVLFNFEVPPHKSTTEITQMVEDLYLDLEDVEPNAKINPAHIKDNSIEIKVELPPIGRMAVTKLAKRFPHVIDGFIPIDMKKDLSHIQERVEEILEYELFMAKRRDSGERVHLDLMFSLPRGETEEDYTDFLRDVSKDLKSIEGVQMVSYEWKYSGRNRKTLVVQIAMPYSVNKAHRGIRVVAETQGGKRKLFGRIRNLFPF